MDILELKKHANDVRKGIIEAVHGAKAGHPGGSLSAADIFTYLYFEEMNIDPENPKIIEDFMLIANETVAEDFYWPTGDTSPWRISPPCAIWALICRDIPVCSMCREWTCPQALWARGFPRLWEWLWAQGFLAGTSGSTRCWETVRSRRARSGRRPCSPATGSWTTWW